MKMRAQLVIYQSKSDLDRRANGLALTLETVTGESWRGVMFTSKGPYRFSGKNAEQVRQRARVFFEREIISTLRQDAVEGTLTVEDVEVPI